MDWMLAKYDTNRGKYKPTKGDLALRAALRRAFPDDEPEPERHKVKARKQKKKRK